MLIIMLLFSYKRHRRHIAVLYRRLKIVVHSLWFDSQLSKRFSSSPKRPDRVLRLPSSVRMRGPFPVTEAAEALSWSLTPSSAEMKNQRCYASTTPYAFMPFTGTTSTSDILSSFCSYAAVSVVSSKIRQKNVRNEQRLGVPSCLSIVLTLRRLMSYIYIWSTHS